MDFSFNIWKQYEERPQPQMKGKFFFPP